MVTKSNSVVTWDRNGVRDYQRHERLVNYGNVHYFDHGDIFIKYTFVKADQTVQFDYVKLIVLQLYINEFIILEKLQ